MEKPRLQKLAFAMALHKKVVRRSARTQRVTTALAPRTAILSISKQVKFQQRYQMRNRIVSKAVPALEFCPFCNSQKCAPLVGYFLGFDSDRILQLFF